jgi:hypothetical protein
LRNDNKNDDNNKGDIEEIIHDNDNNTIKSTSTSKRRWFPSIRRNNNVSPTASATLFCWFCDMRIASVMLNMVHLIFSTLLEVMEMTHSFQVSEPPVMWVLAVIFSGLGVFGAIHFHWTAMFCSSLGLICLFVLYLSEEHIFGLILLGLILYCHVVFICEMKRGIMTKEHYADHQYMDEMGQEALQKAHSYASDVGETTKAVALDMTRTASNALTAASGGAENTERSSKQEVC